MPPRNFRNLPVHKNIGSCVDLYSRIVPVNRKRNDLRFASKKKWYLCWYVAVTQLYRAHLSQRGSHTRLFTYGKARSRGYETILQEVEFMRLGCLRR
jgi:hypothetical protein